MIVWSDILFYVFGGGAILSGLAVLYSRNPVHAVFFLILVFAYGAGLLLLVNAEFLAVIFIVVYVGAIAVLFLFVVMMLNIKLVELNESIWGYVPLGVAVGVVFVLEIFYVLKRDFVGGVLVDRGLENWFGKVDSLPNMGLLGEVLYTYYVYFFMISGLILLVAMIGSIVLTLYHHIDVRRQEVYKQVSRSFADTVINKELER